MTVNQPGAGAGFSRRRLLIGGSLLVSAAAVGGAASRAPAAAAAGELSYSDDFQRADGSVVGDGWVQLRGKWSLVGGTLQPTGNTAQMQIAQTAFELGRTFTVEATVSVGAPGGVHNGLAFNLHDLGNGNQKSYALTLSYGNPSIWALFDIENSAQRFLPAFKVIDIEADHPYTLRAEATHYGAFHVTILDGATALVSEDVDLDPFDQQLSGGFFGLYSQAGNADGAFQVHGISARGAVRPSQPPAPPADEPLVCTPVAGPPYQLPTTTWNVVGASTIGQSQSFFAVAQSLLTHGTDQYVMYYAADRQMTAAHRSTGSDSWTLQPLGNYVPDDGHNSVGGALDRDGQLHVAGNMHNVPLTYYRTSVVGDVTSLTRIPSMVDPDTEQSETYPGFMYDGSGALIYTYRGGVSGAGATYYNIYDETSRTWSRLLDQPLFDGQGAGNSYPSGPKLGPDGRFHLVWVWRDTGDAATNHTLCYARSTDLLHWETAGGVPLSLPLVASTSGVVVDPIPVYRGLLNGNPTIGFDAENRLLLSYYKLDKNLHTQAYVARPLRRDRWDITQISHWTGRYWAEGIGYIPTPPSLSAVGTLADGNLQMTYSYTSATDSYSGTWIMDPDTLQPFTEAHQAATQLPAELTTVRSTFPGMGVQLRNDFGSAGVASQRYVLRYEALPAPITGTQPDPSQLQVYLLQSS